MCVFLQMRWALLVSLKISKTSADFAQAAASVPFEDREHS